MVPPITEDDVGSHALAGQLEGSIVWRLRANIVGWTCEGDVKSLFFPSVWLTLAMDKEVIKLSTSLRNCWNMPWDMELHVALELESKRYWRKRQSSVGAGDTELNMFWPSAIPGVTTTSMWTSSLKSGKSIDFIFEGVYSTCWNQTSTKSMCLVQVWFLDDYILVNYCSIANERIDCLIRLAKG